MDKKCTICQVTKDINNFSKHKIKPDGRTPHCKACVSHYHKYGFHQRGEIECKGCGNLFTPDKYTGKYCGRRECYLEREKLRSVKRMEDPEYRKEKSEVSMRWQKENPGRLADNYLKRTYGITMEDKISMIESQDGKCAICGIYEPERGFCVDHNHATGEVRGILCNDCNVSLGGFRDSVEILKRAIEYLITPRKL